MKNSNGKGMAYYIAVMITVALYMVVTFSLWRYAYYG